MLGASECPPVAGAVHAGGAISVQSDGGKPEGDSICILHTACCMSMTSSRTGGARCMLRASGGAGELEWEESRGCGWAVGPLLPLGCWLVGVYARRPLSSLRWCGFQDSVEVLMLDAPSLFGVLWSG